MSHKLLANGRSAKKDAIRGGDDEAVDGAAERGTGHHIGLSVLECDLARVPEHSSPEPAPPLLNGSGLTRDIADDRDAA